MDIHIQAALLALLGLALNVIIKIYSLKSKAVKANIGLTVKEYFREDWLMILAAIITVGIFLFLVEDYLHYYPNGKGYVKFFAAFVGYTGSDIILRFFSAANKKINNIIDTKTTQADNFMGRSSPTVIPTTKDEK